MTQEAVVQQQAERGNWRWAHLIVPVLLLFAIAVHGLPPLFEEHRPVLSYYYRESNSPLPDGRRWVYTEVTVRNRSQYPAMYFTLYYRCPGESTYNKCTCEDIPAYAEQTIPLRGYYNDGDPRGFGAIKVDEVWYEFGPVHCEKDNCRNLNAPEDPACEAVMSRGNCSPGVAGSKDLSGRAYFDSREEAAEKGM